MRKQKNNDSTPAPWLSAKVRQLDDPQGRTDEQNAERFKVKHGDSARWVDRWKRWLIWDDHRWRDDDTCAIDRLAGDVSESLWRELGDIVKDRGKELDSKLGKAMLAFVTASSNRNGLSAMVERAKHRVATQHEQFNQTPLLLNVANGTVDLRTGKLRAHDRHDFITQLSPVAFDATAACPTWLAFLDRIMDGDQELISFVQRAVGYSLTGETSEQVLFFCHGDGANGKSTFLGAIQRMLGGDYATTALQGLLLAKKFEAHPTEVANLFGRRLVSCVENDRGSDLAEAKIKALTGGDLVTARRMREDPWEFKPAFKIWLLANHLPNVKGDDLGIWRRIRLLPFVVTIPEAERDKDLDKKLDAEQSGILAWAVQGCLEWQRIGLAAPERVMAATQAYKADCDVVERFLALHCDRSDPHARTDARSLRLDFEKWCQIESVDKINQREFGKRLDALGIKSDRYTSGPKIKRGRFYRKGIRLLSDGQTTDEGDER